MDTGLLLVFSALLFTQVIQKQVEKDVLSNAELKYRIQKNDSFGKYSKSLVIPAENFRMVDFW